MHTLPAAARVYLYALYIAAACLLAMVPWIGPDLPRDSRLWELGAFTALAVVAGHAKVPLGRWRVGEHEAGSMSLGFAMIFATLLRFGPQGAVVAGLASTVSSCLRPRQPWYQFLFNAAVNVVETVVASVVFLALNGGTMELNLANSGAAVLAASLVFFFLNTGAVATVIGLSTGSRPAAVWRENFLWSAPSYFAGAVVSTVATMAIGNHLAATLLCAAPAAYLTYLSFREYMVHSEALIRSKEQLANLYLSTIRSLALAIDAKDQYTHQHILRVQQYAVATAQALGIEGDDLKAIETGALLHDIGKLGVPEYVLLKPGRLTDEEYAKIKEHPRIGADILDPVEFPWPVLPVVKYHHERWDGTGYPEGLKGEEIPLTARVLAVADVYDALTSSRSYRGAWSHERAVEQLRRGAGTHFDPRVVEAFCSVIDGMREWVWEHGGGERADASRGAGELAGTTSRSAEAVRDIQRASSELWALYEVAQTLSASIGLQDTLDILAKKLLAIFPDTGCVFLLRDPGDDGAVLTARAAVGLNHEFLTGCRTLGADSLSVRVARERATYHGAFDHDDLLPQTVSTAAWVRLETALIVPIVHQGEVLGTINMYHAKADAFSPHDQYLLEIIAERAAMALFNGLLFDRNRSHAITDPLTGLANVRHLTESVESRVRDADGGTRFALLCLDLDSFKPINDNFGHQRGDQVLRDLAGLFTAAVGAQGTVARYGGDEFVVLLEGAGPPEAEAMANRLKAAVTQYDAGLHHPRLGSIRLGVSVGVACFPSDGGDCAQLLSVADAAMYEDKSERKLGQLVGGGGASPARPGVMAVAKVR